MRIGRRPCGAGRLIDELSGDRMAEADIAYVATAGAAGLALAISAWAWRLRARLNRREGEIETWLADARRQSAACEGALTVFDDVRLALTPEGAA